MKKTKPETSFRERVFRSSEKGFTLLEIVLVLSILGIIFSILLFTFFSLLNYRTLERDTAEVKAYLEEARIYTLGSKKDSSYGVFLDLESVTIFRGNSWNEREEELRRYRFEGLTTVSLTGLGGEDEVVFRRIFGEPSVNGAITLSGPAGVRTVTILSSGVID